MTERLLDDEQEQLEEERRQRLAELDRADRLRPVGESATRTSEPAPEASRLSPASASADMASTPGARLRPLGYRERQRLPIVSAGAPAGSAASYQDEIARLEDQKAHPWGSPENHPGRLGKIGHVLSRIGNIAGDVIAPAVMANIPGTEMHRDVEEARAESNLDRAQARESEEKVRSAQVKNLESEVEARNKPQGKTAEEQTFASLLTDTNPETKQPYTPLEAFAKIKQTAEGVKPQDETKQPVGDPGVVQHTKELTTLTSAMKPDEKQRFLEAYSVGPKDTHAIATKRLEDAKAAAQLTGATRDRELQRQIAERNHQDALAHQAEVAGLETVQYKNKNGQLVSGSLADAKREGAESSARKIQPGDEQKARTAVTQYGRLLDNAQAASDTMAAWDNPKDKELAIRVRNKFLDSLRAGANFGGLLTEGVGGAVGLDPNYLDSFLNSDDYKAMSPAGQQHTQNMFQLYSDAINMMKLETGGVPRGEHFLKLEGSILPQPEKTQAQNRQALKQFESRIKKDASEYARPNDMPALAGVIPPDAKSVLKKDGHTVGYRDKDNKVVMF